MSRVLCAGTRFSIHRGETHPLHQGADVPAPCLDAHSRQLIPQHARAHERLVHVQFVQAPHQLQITLGDGFGSIGQAAAADAD